MTTPTIESLAKRIEATQAEISQLRDRLAELATLPPAPGPDANHAARIAYRVELSKLRNDRAPEVEGVQAAITELQADLERDQAALAQAQAEQTQQIREQRVAAARVRIDELGQGLAAKVAEVQALLGEIHQQIAAVDGDYQALQNNPHQRPAAYSLTGQYHNWRPKPFLLSQYDPSNLPLLYQSGGSVGTTSVAVHATTLRNEEDRKRQFARLVEVTAIANQKMEVAQ